MSPSTQPIVEPTPAADTTTKPLQPTSTPSSAPAQWTPQTVLSTIPASSRPTQNSTSPIPFMHLLERLKTTRREGWRRFDIRHGESIADHMYRMSIMTMLAPPSLSSRLDINRCTRMALVHDMAEALVGDITPVDGVRKAEKSRREQETIDYLTRGLLGAVVGQSSSTTSTGPSNGISNTTLNSDQTSKPAAALDTYPGAQGEALRALWHEYEASETLEARFVHDVDKVELVLQMVEYERAHGGQLDLGEFSRAAARVELPECRAWCAEILAEREAFWNQAGAVPSSGLPGPGATEEMLEEYYGPTRNGAETNGEVSGES